MQLRPLQGSPLAGIDKLIDIEYDDRIETAPDGSGEEFGVLPSAPGQLGHMGERVPPIQPERCHRLNRHSFVDEDEHVGEVLRSGSDILRKGSRVLDTRRPDIGVQIDYLGVGVPLLGETGDDVERHPSPDHHGIPA